MSDHDINIHEFINNINQICIGDTFSDKFRPDEAWDLVDTMSRIKLYESIARPEAAGLIESENT